MTVPADAADLQYIIASLPRSGSNLLAHGLRRTLLAGNPEEHFNVRHQERLLREWGLAAMPPYREFVEHATRATRTANGVFGTKIHWQQVPVIAAKVHPGSHDAAPDELGVLLALFPHARYIRTARRNRIRQAVSYYRAMKSDIWFTYEASEAAPHPLAGLREVDFVQIERYHTILESSERAWDRFFERNGIEPLTVTFEDFTPAYVDTVRSVLNFLDIPGRDRIEIPPTRLVRQSDALTDACVAELTERLVR